MLSEFVSIRFRVTSSPHLRGFDGFPRIRLTFQSAFASHPLPTLLEAGVEISPKSVSIRFRVTSSPHQRASPSSWSNPEKVSIRFRVTSSPHPYPKDVGQMFTAEFQSAFASHPLPTRSRMACPAQKIPCFNPLSRHILSPPVQMMTPGQMKDIMFQSAFASHPLPTDDWICCLDQR